LQAKPISVNKLCNVTKGNDTWAFAIVSSTVPTSLSLAVDSTTVPAEVQQILDQYSKVFQDPQKLPPERSYDHSIPLVPGAVPINARPYHYSP
jgi:hypothetical protein